MTLRFLHAQEDTELLIQTIYSQGFFIFEQSGEKRSIPLSLSEACGALTSDLFFWMTGRSYEIGTLESPKILYLTSCGRQSHPRYINTQIRYPGEITLSKDNLTPEGQQLFSVLKNFFKKNYTSQNYIPTTRANAYFGKHYLQLDRKYMQEPEPDYIRNGVIWIVTKRQYTEEIQNLLDSDWNGSPALIDYKIDRRLYWANSACEEICIELAFDQRKFDFQEFQELASRLTDKAIRIRAEENNLFWLVDGVRGEMQTPKNKWNMVARVEKRWVIARADPKTD